MWIILFSEVSIVLEKILFIPCKDSFFPQYFTAKIRWEFHLAFIRKYDIFQIFRWRYFIIFVETKKEERWQHRKEFY